LITSRVYIKVNPFQVKRLLAYLSTRLQQLLYGASERTKESKKLLKTIRNGGRNTSKCKLDDQHNVEVVTGTTSKMPVFSGNHGDDWAIWEMKMSAHLMEKGLDACLDPTIETRLPNKEN